MVFMAMQRLFSLGMTLNSIHNSCCWPFVFVTITIKMTKKTILRKTFFFLTITDFTCIEGEDQSIWGCDSELSVCLEIWIWDKNRIINVFSTGACQKYCLDWKETKKCARRKWPRMQGWCRWRQLVPRHPQSFSASSRIFRSSASPRWSHPSTDWDLVHYFRRSYQRIWDRDLKHWIHLLCSTAFIVSSRVSSPKRR